MAELKHNLGVWGDLVLILKHISQINGLLKEINYEVLTCRLYH